MTNRQAALIMNLEVSNIKKSLLLSNQEQIYAFKTNIPNNPHADFIIIIQKCHISDILNHNVKETHEICNRKKTIKDILQKNTKECRLCVMPLWTKNVNLHHRKRKQDSKKRLEIVENIR